MTDWWRHDGDDGETWQGTSLSTSSGELLVDDTNTSESGSLYASTNVSIKKVGSSKTLQLGKSCSKYDTDEFGKAATYYDTGEFSDATEYDRSFTANDDAHVYNGADVTSTVTRLTSTIGWAEGETVARQSAEVARNGRY